MILCRRTSTLSLKNIKNRDAGPILTHQKRENDYNGSNRINNTKANNNKSGAKFKRNHAPIDRLNGDSPLLKSNGNGFDLGSNIGTKFGFKMGIFSCIFCIFHCELYF